MFQYYICKLIKCQGKLLGKNWRKANNMRLFYAIYRMLRHRLADDWAHGNLDNNLNFQMHERVISTRVRMFHQRRYMSESRVKKLKNRGFGAGSVCETNWVDDDQTVNNPAPVI